MRPTTIYIILLWTFLLAGSALAMAEVEEKQRQAIEELTEEQLAAIAEFDRRWDTDPRPFIQRIQIWKAFVMKADELAEQGGLMTPDQEALLQRLKERIAQIPPLLPEEYTLLCKSELNVGVSWENGGWVSANYHNEDRLVITSKDNNCKGPKLTEDISQTETGKIAYYSRHVCLNQRPFGKPYYEYQSRYCEESYANDALILDDEAKTPWVVRISCDLYDWNMFIKPNGWYHYARIHTNLRDKPENDYKDSQHMEVGKCAMIKP
ncbi:MAG: hypothetical protein WD032_05170 [Nitrospirales bacterium]